MSMCKRAKYWRAKIWRSERNESVIGNASLAYKNPTPATGWHNYIIIPRPHGKKIYKLITGAFVQRTIFTDAY